MGAVQHFFHQLHDGTAARNDGAQDHLGGELGRRPKAFDQGDGFVFPAHDSGLRGRGRETDRGRLLLVR